MLKTNVEKIVKFKVQGKIIPPCTQGSYSVGHDGRARKVPGTGGITLNFKVGDLANKYIGDHLEPCVSSTCDGNPKERQSPQNAGYNVFSCVGNEVEIISGAAKGKKGIVTGHHGGAEHVMIDFDDATLNKLNYDDKLLITSHGIGLQILGYEEIAIFSLAPTLFEKMGIKERAGKIEVPVVACVPAVAMGSGLGSAQAFSGDYDIQTSDSKTVKEFGLDKLKLGDLVAIMDHDSNFGWSYKQGAVSIGVIIHGDSYVAGHGPGCQTLMTSLKGSIVPKINPNANIGRYLKIGRHRSSKKS